MMSSINLKWTGAAGFVFGFEGMTFAFDPFLSRRDPDHPQLLSPKELGNIGEIFLGHGHFDHMFDVPKICSQSDIKVYASSDNVKKLSHLGVEAQKLSKADESSKSLSSRFTIIPFKSRHVRFDMPLVGSTLKRLGLSQCMHVFHLGVSYPAGGVRTYYFELGGKKFLFVSSAGCTRDELLRYRDLEVDYLLMPLQGHSHIQTIGAEMTSVIKPKVVIPHHHDNFYHPMSQNIDLKPFREDLKTLGFKGDLLEIPLLQDCQI